MCVWVSPCPRIHPPPSLSLSLSVYLSSVCPSACLPAWLCLPAFQPCFCLSLSVCLGLCLSIETGTHRYKQIDLLTPFCESSALEAITSRINYVSTWEAGGDLTVRHLGAWDLGHWRWDGPSSGSPYFKSRGIGWPPIWVSSCRLSICSTWTWMYLDVPGCTLLGGSSHLVSGL